MSLLPLTFRLAARMERARLLRWRARAHRVLAFLLGLIVRVEVSGLENIPQHGPIIFAANHINSLDLPLFLSLCRRPDFTGIMGDEVRGKPLRLRLIPFFCDIILAPRGARESVLEDAVRALARGDLVAILPEGLCSKTGVMGKAYSGVARLSSRSGVPVVFGAWYGQETIAANLRRLRRATVRIFIGPAMPLQGGTAEQAQRETDRLMRAVASMLPPAYRGIYAGDVTAGAATAGGGGNRW